ncbi:MAG TPA: 3-dehydroquinate synthase, partial [Candidatus Paceibacterota bacterium]|nr:3-dehydroquinate synthase [Candidatus Paceibacterota bacterium]
MKKITIQTSKPYTIEINKGLVVKQLFQAIPEGFMITDSNISRLYPHLVREPAFIIEAGEKSKSFENYRAIIEKLSETNKKVIVALGGGVVGDLAGFVASTYKRGIDLI